MKKYSIILDSFALFLSLCRVLMLSVILNTVIKIQHVFIIIKTKYNYLGNIFLRNMHLERENALFSSFIHIHLNLETLT